MNNLKWVEKVSLFAEAEWLQKQLADHSKEVKIKSPAEVNQINKRILEIQKLLGDWP